MTRIRYKRTNSELITTKPILCNNRFVNIRINLTNMKYYITDADSNEVIIQGVEANVQSLKRKAKSDVQAIGATFYDEVRNGKKERKLIIASENN